MLSGRTVTVTPTLFGARPAPPCPFCAGWAGHEGEQRRHRRPGDGGHVMDRKRGEGKGSEAAGRRLVRGGAGCRSSAPYVRVTFTPSVAVCPALVFAERYLQFAGSNKDLWRPRPTPADRRVGHTLRGPALCVAYPPHRGRSTPCLAWRGVARPLVASLAPSARPGQQAASWVLRQNAP